jgi:2-hydroxy-3-keto-5-methylthiopentenyl-1-phosphate phosphatase
MTEVSARCEPKEPCATDHTPNERAVFVSDFDGTMARPDFYHLVRRDLVPKGTPDFWSRYRAGDMTHFEALRAFFEAAEGGEPALRRLLDMMEMPDDLPAQVESLREAGWDVVVVSAGLASTRSVRSIGSPRS